MTHHIAFSSRICNCNKEHSNRYNCSSEILQAFASYNVAATEQIVAKLCINLSMQLKTAAIAVSGFFETCNSITVFIKLAHIFQQLADPSNAIRYL